VSRGGCINAHRVGAPTNIRLLHHYGLGEEIGEADRIRIAEYIREGGGNFKQKRRIGAIHEGHHGSRFLEKQKNSRCGSRQSPCLSGSSKRKGSRYRNNRRRYALSRGGDKKKSSLRVALGKNHRRGWGRGVSQTKSLSQTERAWGKIKPRRRVPQHAHVAELRLVREKNTSQKKIHFLFPEVSERPGTRDLLGMNSSRSYGSE